MDSEWYAAGIRHRAVRLPQHLEHGATAGAARTAAAPRPRAAPRCDADPDAPVIEASVGPQHEQDQGDRQVEEGDEIGRQVPGPASRRNRRRLGRSRRYQRATPVYRH